MKIVRPAGQQPVRRTTTSLGGRSPSRRVVASLTRRQMLWTLAGLGRVPSRRGPCPGGSCVQSSTRGTSSAPPAPGSSGSSRRSSAASDARRRTSPSTGPPHGPTTAYRQPEPRRARYRPSGRCRGAGCSSAWWMPASNSSSRSGVNRSTSRRQRVTSCTTIDLRVPTRRGLARGHRVRPGPTRTCTTPSGRPACPASSSGPARACPAPAAAGPRRAGRCAPGAAPAGRSVPPETPAPGRRRARCSWPIRVPPQALVAGDEGLVRRRYDLKQGGHRSCPLPQTTRVRQRLASRRGEPAGRARRHRPRHLPPRRRRPWGDGTTSASDGQRFAMPQKVLQRTYSTRFNDFALEFYSFVADNYAPFSTAARSSAPTATRPSSSTACSTTRATSTSKSTTPNPRLHRDQLRGLRDGRHAVLPAHPQPAPPADLLRRPGPRPRRPRAGPQARPAGGELPRHRRAVGPHRPVLRGVPLGARHGVGRPAEAQPVPGLEPLLRRQPRARPGAEDRDRPARTARGPSTRPTSTARPWRSSAPRRPSAILDAEIRTARALLTYATGVWAE